MNTKTQSKPKTDTKTRASNIARMTATSGGGGGAISLMTRVSLGLDAESDIASVCRQLQLVLIYLGNLGGTATVGEIVTYANKAPKGANFWGYSNGEPYEQDCRKIIAHYSAKAFGHKDYNKKVGKTELLRLVS
tara:strand:+ start:179 stop:580 length:402 start_codon:yes stop_codon:yes gene_type:complete